VRDSGAPSIGDLVVALYDEQRDIFCVGLVMETKGIECKVLWSSESQPKGWWARQALKVISPSGTTKSLMHLTFT
tara:strand:+ start:3661 stop:3885 length:225 start_codon:yes stop_codon:yes gene_type:complete